MTTSTQPAHPSLPHPSTRGGIVVGVDGSEHSDRAVAWAAEQATIENRPMVLLHASALTGHSIYPGAEYLMLDETAMAAVAADAKRILTAATRLAHRANSKLRVTVLDLRTDPRQTLLEASEDAHLVVVGSRGRGHTASVLMGSVSATVAARASCPVVVVRPQANEYRTPGVVVGVRFSAGSAPVLEHAFSQASLRHLPLRVVHFYFDTEDDDTDLSPMPGSTSLREELREPMAEAVAGLAEKYPEVDVQLDLEPGAFRKLLAEAAGQHDLLVIGRRSGGLLGRTIGTWSTLSIVEHAAGTVAVVPETRT